MEAFLNYMYAIVWATNGEVKSRLHIQFETLYLTLLVSLSFMTTN